MLGSFKIYDILKEIISQQKSLKVAGVGALFLSHVVWNNLNAQSTFATREIVKRLVYLANFNQLVYESEAETSVEGIMEISFYALLAIINLSHNNVVCQNLTSKLGGIEVILAQLKSPTYEPKKSACFCLGNIIQGNPDNAQQLITSGGVSVLVNLINDEEDDDLSNKAYQVSINRIN